MKYNVKGLDELSKQLHEFQINTGFTNSDKTQRLMLVHSEISEAFEAIREDKYCTFLDLYEMDHQGREQIFKDKFEKNIKDTMQDEIADAIIRLLAFCGENDIHIESHIEAKMRYNELRGFKYGGKNF